MPKPMLRGYHQPRPAIHQFCVHSMLSYTPWQFQQATEKNFLTAITRLEATLILSSTLIPATGTIYSRSFWNLPASWYNYRAAILGPRCRGCVHVLILLDHNILAHAHAVVPKPFSPLLKGLGVRLGRQSHSFYVLLWQFQPEYFFLMQRQIQTAVFGGKSSVKGAASGTASSVAFTPLQVTYNVFLLWYRISCVVFGLIMLHV